MSRKHIDAPLQPTESFGQVVRKRRLELDISQAELGERCGVSQEYLSGIERGKRNPTLQTIWILAAGLRESPGVLLIEAEQRIGTKEN